MNLGSLKSFLLGPGAVRSERLGPSLRSGAQTGTGMKHRDADTRNRVEKFYLAERVKGRKDISAARIALFVTDPHEE